MTIVFIHDLGNRDLAEQEVKLKLRAKFSRADIDCVAINPFNTIEAGFVLAQLAMNNMGNIIYVNVAPRKQDLAAVVDNAGEKLVCGVYNGNIIVAVNSGFTLSYLKDVVNFWEVNCKYAGSQFRSRDVFPEQIYLISQAINEVGYSSLSEIKYVGANVTNIPDMPSDKILYSDYFGNLKINNVLTEEQKDAPKLHVRIQGTGVNVNNGNGNGIFSVPDGEFVIAQGSSGWNTNRFLEISLRGGNAAKHFGNPLPGTKVNIEVI